jgi:UDP-glucose 4-epimerase
MRVLITGGAGFIGSHLCDAFVERGDEVTILDNLSTGSYTNVRHLNSRALIINGDIRNKSLVEELVQKTELILHMAAVVGVENILMNPIESISINYSGSEIVLNAAVKYDKRIIIASTSEIYGKNPKQPLSESDDRVIGSPQKFRWTYSDSKSLEESIAYAFYLSKKLKVTIVRLFNTVGPRQTGQYGMVIPRFINSALKNVPLEVYGNGNQSRSFCHVKDVVRAFILLANNDTAIGEVYNIGNTEEITIKSLALRIISQLNSKSQLKFISYENALGLGYEDVVRRVPDISKINNLTGWQPNFDLRKIISDIENELTKRI